jgi:hypothetical protein
MDFAASRRNFLKNAGGGLGMMALADLLSGAERKPHFPGKAKSVIFLFMEGGPSQMDLFDPKPELQKWHGKPLPPSMTKDLKLAFIKPTAAVLGSPREFKQHGQSGMTFSDYLPHTAQVADELCMVRSMHTDAFNHHPGQLLLFTGSMQFGVRRWARGQFTGLEASRRICPVLRCWRPVSELVEALRISRLDSCLLNIRALCCGAPAIRFCI